MNWHTEYQRKVRGMSEHSLRYVIADCQRAIAALPENPKCGQYQDEIHYCAQELYRRAR